MRSLETVASFVVISLFLTKYTHRLASSRRHLEGNVLMPVGEVSHLDPGLAMSWTASCICSCEVVAISWLPSAFRSSLNWNMTFISCALKGISQP